MNKARTATTDCSRRQQHERRVHHRIQLADREGLILHADDAIAVSVADLCLGGIAFSYQGEKAWPETELVLDFRDGDLHLEKVGVRVVWQSEARQGTTGNGQPPLRRCGLKFTSIDKNQEMRLRSHIARILDAMP